MLDGPIDQLCASRAAFFDWVVTESYQVCEPGTVVDCSSFGYADGHVLYPRSYARMTLRYFLHGVNRLFVTAPERVRQLARLIL